MKLLGTLIDFFKAWAYYGDIKEAWEDARMKNRKR